MPLLLLMLCLAVPLPIQAQVETADPNATPRAQQLLAYLKGLPGQPDRRLISGQMIWVDLANRTAFFDYKTLEDTQKLTGAFPGLVGILEPIGEEAGGPAIRQYATDHWNKGGLIMLHILINHMPYQWYPNGIDLTALLADPRYLAYLDELAAELKRYQDAGVVLLARPFLEMNGKWMWFYTTDYTKFVALWRHFVHAMTSRGVHNLLYVYSPNADFGGYLERYPGDAYVDVVGLDYYGELGPSPMAKWNGYDELVSTGKPFALTEYGPFSNEDPVTYQSRDYRFFLDGVKQNMPKAVWWMAWSAPWDLASQLHISEVMNDPYVVDRPVPFATIPSPTQTRQEIAIDFLPGGTSRPAQSP